MTQTLSSCHARRQRLDAPSAAFARALTMEKVDSVRFECLPTRPPVMSWPTSSASIIFSIFSREMRISSGFDSPSLLLRGAAVVEKAGELDDGARLGQAERDVEAMADAAGRSSGVDENDEWMPRTNVRETAMVGSVVRVYAERQG